MAARKNIDWDKVPELGKMSDHAIGKLYGVDHTRVYKVRKSRGIPAFSVWNARPKPGGMPDVEYMEKYRVSDVAVRKTRKRRGIPTYMNSCSICGLPIKSVRRSDTPGGHGATPACKECRYYVKNAKKETNSVPLIKCIAKASRVANLTEEKILKYKERMNENHERNPNNS